MLESTQLDSTRDSIPLSIQLCLENVVWCVSTHVVTAYLSEVQREQLEGDDGEDARETVDGARHPHTLRQVRLPHQPDDVLVALLADQNGTTLDIHTTDTPTHTLYLSY